MWEILQEKMYRMRITDLGLSTMPLTNGCLNHEITQIGPLHYQSLFQFIQVNHAHIYTLCLNSPHTRVSSSSIVAHLEATAEV